LNLKKLLSCVYIHYCQLEMKQVDERSEYWAEICHVVAI